MSDIYPAGGASSDGSSPETNASPGGGVRRQAETAKQKLGEAGQALKSEAQTFAQDAKSRASERAGQATTKVGSTIHTFADAIRQAGDNLGEHDQTLAARLVREAADGLEGFSRALAEKRPEEMLNDVRELGRRNPAAFIAGSVLAGLALGRFLRASERNEEADYGGGEYGLTGDAETAVSGSMLGFPDSAEPYEADLGHEEATHVSADSPDVLQEGIVDQQTVAEQASQGIASPAALAEGGDLSSEPPGENIETGQTGARSFPERGL